MGNINNHTMCLAQYLYNQMKELKHTNGVDLCVFYGKHHLADPSKQGPIVNFNLIRPNGQYFGYSEIDRLASLENIMIRVGSFCNPGALSEFVGVTKEEIKKNAEKGKICGDDQDIGTDGKPLGSVRISIGYMTKFEDVEIFLKFLKKYFLNYNQQSVQPQALKKLIETKTSPYTLIDVRAAEELKIYGQIPTSHNVPIYELNEEAMNLSSEEWLSKYSFPKIKQGDKICLYCRSQRRSNMAARTLEGFGYTNIYILREGVIGWAYLDSSVLAYESYEPGKETPPQPKKILVVQ